METTLLVRLAPFCAKDDDRAPVRRAIWKPTPKIFGVTYIKCSLAHDIFRNIIFLSPNFTSRTSHLKAIKCVLYLFKKTARNQNLYIQVNTRVLGRRKMAHFSEHFPTTFLQRFVDVSTKSDIILIYFLF